MSIPAAALELQAKLADQWATCSWDELEGIYGESLSHIEYSKLPPEDRADVTDAYTDVKHYVLEDHNVYFMRHASGAVHMTCCHVDDYVTLDSENRIVFESRSAGSVEFTTRLKIVVRNFLGRWAVFRRKL